MRTCMMPSCGLVTLRCMTTTLAVKWLCSGVRRDQPVCRQRFQSLKSSAESNDLLGFSCFPSTSCEYTLCTSGAKSSLKRNALRVSWHNACAWASMHAEPARAAAVCSRLYGGLDGDTPA